MADNTQILFKLGVDKQKAQQDFAAFAVDLGKRLDGIEAKFDELGKALKGAGSGFDSATKSGKAYADNLGSITKQQEEFGETVKDSTTEADTFKAVLGAELVWEGLTEVIGLVKELTTGVIELATSTAEYAKSQEVISKTFKVQKEDLAALVSVLGDAGEAVDVLGQLNQNIADAAKNGGQSAERFKTLGIAFSDLDGKARNVGAVFNDLVALFQAGKLSQEQLAEATGLLGEEASKKLIPVLGQFDQLKQKAIDAGLVLSGPAAEAARKFADDVRGLNVQVDGLAIAVGQRVIPAVNQLIPPISDAITQIKQVLDANPQLIAQLETIGKVLGTGLGKTIEYVTRFVVNLSKQFEALGFAAVGLSKAVEGNFEEFRTNIVKFSETSREGFKTFFAGFEEIPKVTKQAEAGFASLAQVVDSATGKIIKPVAELKNELAELQAVQKQTIADSANALEKQRQAFDAAAKGTDPAKQVEAAKQLVKVADDVAAKQIEAALKVYRAKVEIIEREADSFKEAQTKTLAAGAELEKVRLDATRARVDAQKTLEDSVVKAAQDRATKIAAIEAGTQSKFDAQIKERAELLRSQGYDEIETAQAVAKIKIQALQSEIAALASQIALKREAKAADAEIIGLTNQLEKAQIELSRQSRIATGQIIEGTRTASDATRQATAATVDYINKYSQSLEELQSNLLGLIEKTKKSVVDASGGIGKAIDDINKTAAGSISTILGASLDKIQGYVDEALQRYRDAAEYNARAPIQIAGLFQLQFEKAAEVLKAAFAKRDELFAAEARKQEEAFQKQQEADIAARAAAQKELEDLEEEHADRLKDIHKDIRNVRRDLAADEKKEREDSAAEVARIETDAANARIRRETENNARILAERKKLAADLADAERQSQTDLLDAQAEGIVDRAKLEEQLKKQETEGDTEGAGKTKKALDRLTEDEALAQEKADAEKLAREKATSAEELKILLDGIDEKFRNQKQYLDQVRELEDLGRADQIAKLTENFTKQQEVIAKAQADALKALTDRLAAEQKAREDAAAAEDKAFADRVQKEKDDSKTRLDNLKTAANERIDELKKDLKREQTAFDEAATEIEKRVQALNDKILGIIKPAQDALAGLGGQAPAGGSTPGEGGGNSTSGPVDTPPPSPPAPGAGTHPSGGTQTGGGGRKDKAAASSARAFIESTDRLLSQLSVRPDLAAGIVTELKALVGKTDEFLRSKGLSSKDKQSLTDIKEILGFFISQTAQPDITTGPAKTTDKPTDTGQTQSGQTGGPATTTKPKFTDKPTDPGKKADIPTQKRDAAFADSLVFRADSAKSKDEAKKIQDEAQAALKSGKIDADDFNRIKARLGYASFQGGFELPPSFNPSGTPAGGLGGGPALPTGTIPTGGGSRAIDSNPISAAGGSSGATPPGTAAGQKSGIAVNIGSLNVNDIQAAIDAFGEALKEEFRKKGIPV